MSTSQPQPSTPTGDAVEPIQATSATAFTTQAPAPEGAGLLDTFKPDAIPVALAWIIGTIVVVRLIKRLVERLSERVARHRLAIKQGGTLISFVLYVLAIAMSFSSLFTLSPEAIFALSGTLAVTLGFGLKDVAASFFAGITILINKPFQVGDRISFGGFYGEVKEIGLRTVRLVTLDDNLVTIPTNKVLTDAVANANAGALECMVVTSFHILPGADHARAREIVQEAVLASKYLYLGKPMMVLVSTVFSGLGQVTVELTAKAYVFDARYEKSFASDITDRVLASFRDNCIGIPGATPAKLLDGETG